MTTLKSAALAALLVLGMLLGLSWLAGPAEGQQGSGVGGPHPRSFLQTVRRIAPSGIWSGGDWVVGANQVTARTRFPAPTAPTGGVGDTSIQYPPGGVPLITLMWDDAGASSMPIYTRVCDGTSAQRTPVAETSSAKTASVVVDVVDPGTVGFLNNGIPGTDKFRLGQDIKIGTNAKVRIMRVDDANTFTIETAQTWASGDDIDIWIPCEIAVPAQSAGCTHTGRTTAEVAAPCNSACDDNRKDPTATQLATNTSGSTSVTIGGAEFFNTGERTSYDGGMIRFCTTSPCTTSTEAARYEIADVTGANALTTTTAITPAHTSVYFYVTAQATDDCHTAAQLATWRADGFGVQYHGKDHSSMQNMTEAQLVTDIETGLPILEANYGAVINTMTYPFEGVSPGVANVMRRYFRAALGGKVGCRRSGGLSENCPPLETYRLSRSQALDTQVDGWLANIQPQVDSAYTAGTWLIEFGHNVTTGHEANLGDFIDDTILNHPDMKWVGVSEALDIMGNAFDGPGVMIGADGTISSGSVQEGKAQAGTATTMTLQKDASATINDYYQGWWMRTLTGTGAGQGPCRAIDYVGSTRVLTLGLTTGGGACSLSPAPDATTGYILVPPVARITDIVGNLQVWGNMALDSDGITLLDIGSTVTGMNLSVDRSSAGFMTEIVVDRDGGDGYGVLLASRGDGAVNMFSAVGAYEQTAASAASILNCVAYGNPNGDASKCKFNFLRDGTTFQRPQATAPATCVLGDRYIDTSGADCVCTDDALDTWTNTHGVGTCV